MVIHRREICAPKGTLCNEPMAVGDERDDDPGKVTCEKCAVRWQVMMETHRKLATMDNTGRCPICTCRTDDQVLALLDRARAQGVRSLEVRSDGSFVAVMDPPPPTEVRAPAGQTLSPEEQREQAEAEAVARHAR